MLAVAVLAAVLVIAAGCGSGSQRGTTTRAASTTATTCTLSAKQHRVIRRAKVMIGQMHKLDAPLQTVHETGPRALELELERFQLSIGVLPVAQRALLIRKAKSAVGLCKDCSDALEAMEPAIQTRLGGSPCSPGS